MLPWQRILLIGGTVLAILAIIIGATSGHGHGASAFLDKLHEETFYNTGGDGSELATGWEACGLMKDRNSKTEAAHQIWMENPKFTYDNALQFTSIASDYLC